MKNISLGPDILGAEVLQRIARSRQTGILKWQQPGVQAELLFANGRPESAHFNGNAVTSRDQVVGFVRGFAALLEGTCSFEAVGDSPAGESHKIDTLGECAVVLAKTLSDKSVKSVLSARSAWKIAANADFARIAGAVEGLVGCKVVAPAQPTVLAELAGTDLQRGRAWLVMLALGGVASQRPSVARPKSGSIPAIAKPEATKYQGNNAGTPDSRTSPPAQAARERPVSRPIVDRPISRRAPSAPVRLTPPKDPQLRAVFFEVEKAYKGVDDKNHYEVLEVEESASVDEIRAAYFKKAKQWHSDRFSSLDLEDGIKEHAKDLFQHSEQAYSVLANEEERSTYNYVLDRKKRGLPWEPRVIMQAEGLFKKGKTLVEKGEGAAAVGILKEAVETNPGEPEFWVYYGFATFVAGGATAFAQAEKLILKGLAQNERLDVAHEFLGRMLHSLGKKAQAKAALKKAMDMNPKNVSAHREYRVITMREANEKKGPEGGLSGLWSKVLKK